ncbi:MAG TPA: anti-sigma factor [Thermoanaerobaculia bacterium]|jgi:anti-sigma-K factor RskA|nr:anti-sigma factor [Thermoanaerobaculia bacterium]
MTAPPHSARFEELLPAHALGALDGDDLRELEEHLAAGCAECRRQLDLWHRELEALAGSVEPVAPSETTRARVLRMTAGAAGAAAAPAPRRLPRWLSLAAAALLVAAVWGVAGQMRLRGELERLTAERDRLARQVTALDREVTLARDAAARAAQALQVVAAPGVKSVVLAGLAAAPQATGQTYVNPRQGGALFYAFDLPALPPGKTYELWYIAAGKPVPAGTFAVDPHGAATVQVERVPDAASIQAWAVTVEPAGGVPQPTGAMVLKG